MQYAINPYRPASRIAIHPTAPHRIIFFQSTKYPGRKCYYCLHAVDLEIAPAALYTDRGLYVTHPPPFNTARMNLCRGGARALSNNVYLTPETLAIEAPAAARWRCRQLASLLIGYGGRSVVAEEQGRPEHCQLGDHSWVVYAACDAVRFFV